VIRSAALLLILSAPADAAPGTGPRLGERIKVGDESVVPIAGLDLYLKQKPLPGLYRHVAVNWRDRPAAGTYPAEAFDARQEGDVYLSLDVGADGKPTGCRVTRPSGIAALDEHRCAHALAQIRFYPGLDDKGRRIGGTVEGRLSYNIVAGGIARPALIEGIGGDYVSRRAEPLQPITVATLGLPGGVKLPSGTDTIRGTLAVSAKGKVTACLLTFPTFDDALDKGACDRLRKQRFRPALDRKQRSVAGLYFIDLPLPR
jgi:TonB family protein